MLWTLLGIAAFVAVLHEPTRKRIDDAISVLTTGKTSAQREADRRKADLEDMADELREAAASSDIDLSKGEAEDMVQKLVERHQGKSAE